MTEEEWRALANPTPMLEWLTTASQRKLRMFACACCNLMFEDIKLNPWDERAVDLAEQFADGVATRSALETGAAETTSDHTPAYACRDTCVHDGFAAAVNASGNASWALAEHLLSVANLPWNDPSFPALIANEHAAQSLRLADIFGNPFSRIVFDPSWGTEAVVGLARGMYESRDFGPMPVLADALEDAGCADGAVLAHCRGDGPHGRGCWVVDLVLGKE